MRSALSHISLLVLTIVGLYACQEKFPSPAESQYFQKFYSKGALTEAQDLYIDPDTQDMWILTNQIDITEDTTYIWLVHTSATGMIKEAFDYRKGSMLEGKSLVKTDAGLFIGGNMRIDSLNHTVPWVGMVGSDGTLGWESQLTYFSQFNYTTQMMRSDGLGNIYLAGTTDNVSSGNGPTDLFITKVSVTNQEIQKPQTFGLEGEDQLVGLLSIPGQSGMYYLGNTASVKVGLENQNFTIGKVDPNLQVVIANTLFGTSDVDKALDVIYDKGSFIISFQTGTTTPSIHTMSLYEQNNAFKSNNDDSEVTTVTANVNSKLAVNSTGKVVNIISDETPLNGTDLLLYQNVKSSTADWTLLKEIGGKGNEVIKSAIFQNSNDLVLLNSIDLQNSNRVAGILRLSINEAF